MELTDLFFYLFATVLVGSALMVISARNPVHAVMFLILAFINAAGLFLMLGAEFLAFVLVIVYVGAVAVLFLFVVMMLDVDFAELRAGYMKYFPIGALIGLVVLGELAMLFGAWKLDAVKLARAAAPTPQGVTNAKAMGQALFTNYIHYFEAVGIILLIAMIGAIVLTLRKREGVKRQDVGAQVARTPKDAIEIRKVETGKGI
jgi:NADH-quinone oxidoreductase subunit J